jgi:hypothetical protein
MINLIKFDGKFGNLMENLREYGRNLLQTKVEANSIINILLNNAYI